MHSKSDIIEIIIINKADEVIKGLFQSLLSRYQIGLETSMKDSDFIFDCIHLLLNPNRGGSYIDSPYWIIKEKH